MSRKIIHIDADCFYAAIEMRDNPALQGIPMAVGGIAERRGVLT
ncbi:MAG: DNA polymerase IV, partial [Luminiphilus sp.]|nr:DNA polymerase IV [Luminiphilus sp.]